MSRIFFGKAWLLPALAALAFVALAGCEPAQSAENVQSGAKKVAVFEGGEVTQGELEEQLDLFAQQSGAGEIPPDSPQYEAAVSQIMPQLVGQEIAETYAREEGITVTDEDVEQELRDIREQVGQQVADQAAAQGQEITPEEGYRQALEQAGLTEDELREQVRQGLPIQKVQEEVTGDAAPTEEEVRAYYDENQEIQFTTPEQRCARHILFTPDQEDLANEVRDRIEDGEDFAALAEEYSQDPASAENGGDLGCLGQGETVPEFDEALFGAEEGDLIGPVETEYGFHLIELQEIRDEEAQPFEEVAPQIEEQLTLQRQSEGFDRWLQEQIEQRNVRYLPGYEPTPPAAPEEAVPEDAVPEEGAPEEAPAEGEPER